MAKLLVKPCIFLGGHSVDQYTTGSNNHTYCYAGLCFFYSDDHCEDSLCLPGCMHGQAKPSWSGWLHEIPRPCKTITHL